VGVQEGKDKQRKLESRIRTDSLGPSFLSVLNSKKYGLYATGNEKT
jgi:hypothetical protein